MIEEPIPGEEAPAAPERRYPYAWVILAVLFLVVLGQALAESLSRDRGPGDRYMEENTALRQAVVLDSLLGGVGTPRQRREAKRALENYVSGLVETARKEPEAAALYAVMRRELDREIAPEYLKVLANSPKPADRALAQLYEKPALSRTQADALLERLPRKPFLYEVARVHALEEAGNESARQKFRGAAIRMVLGMSVGCLLAFVGLGLWLVYFVARTQGQAKPLGHPVGDITPAAADALALRAAQVFAVFYGISVVVGLVGSVLPRELRFPLLVAAVIAGVVALSRFPVLGRRITLASIGLTRENLGRNILWGIAGFCANIPLMLVAVAVAQFFMRYFPQPRHPATDLLANNPGPAVLFGLWLMAAVMAPFWEEIMFRGMLFPALSKVMKSWVWGLVVSSFAFAAIHPQGVPLWLGLATVGGMSCFLAYQTRSLVPSIVMHAVHNTAILTFGLLLMS